jgi:hypothetical protein
MRKHKTLNTILLLAIVASLLLTCAASTLVPAGESRRRDEGAALFRPQSELGEQPVHRP